MIRLSLWILQEESTEVMGLLSISRREEQDLGLLWWLCGKESTCQCRRHRFGAWSLKIPSTWLGAPKSRGNNYWACALEPGSWNCWAQELSLLRHVHPGAHALQQGKPPQWEAYTPQLESCVTRESPHPAMKTQCSRNNLYKKKRHRILVGLLTDDVNYGPQINLLFARFLQCEVAIFSFLYFIC